MIRNVLWTIDGAIQENLPLEKVKTLLSSPNHLIWVDIFDAKYEESLFVLRDIFEFHPLAIDDALEETHIPKIDDWEDYLCLVFQAINLKQQQEIPELLTQEIDIFIGKNYILTYHETQNITIDKVWDRAVKNNRLFERGSANLLYLLLDETASDYILKTDQIAMVINDIEDQLFDDPNTALLAQIFSLKRSILNLRQSISPQREVLNKLARGDYSILGERSNVYFRDVYDHFFRLFDIAENLQDLTSNTLEIFLSTINNRMNGIMKTLTIITTLFMPISFLAGFFGMNFFAPVEKYTWWTSTPTLVIVILASVLFPVIMLAYFFRKGWMK
ncbi:MAG: magnesium/cobalt transporter CorA [Candidatus Aminicenantes bacterium]|nr:magnesium/cobalt transporter CorA [Candidatus Aminicenantes bacterium]